MRMHGGRELEAKGAITQFGSDGIQTQGLPALDLASSQPKDDV